MRWFRLDRKKGSQQTKIVEKQSHSSNSIDLVPLLPDQPIGIDYYAESAPIAQRTLKSPIFWLPGHEDGPISDDPGADALDDFWSWRDDNRSAPVHSFLIHFLNEYGLDNKRIAAVAGSSAEAALGELHLDANLFDDLVLTVAFAQFMKEGVVDRDIHSMAMDAASRQANSEVINFRCDESSSLNRKNGLVEISTALTLMPIRC